MRRIEIPVTMATKMLAKAIHAIQKEAEAATLEALSSKDGIVVLQGPDRETVSINPHVCEGVFWHDGNGFKLVMDRQRFRYTSGDWVQQNWRPGQWVVREVRIDGNGLEWSTDHGRFVIDDFGTLVPVKGGAQ